MKRDKILRKYYEVWKFIGTELDIDRNVMNTIEEDHSRDRDRLHALIEIWLSGAELTDTKQQYLNKALQSQHVISAVAGMSYATFDFIPRPLLDSVRRRGLLLLFCTHTECILFHGCSILTNQDYSIGGG